MFFGGLISGIGPNHHYLILILRDLHDVPVCIHALALQLLEILEVFQPIFKFILVWVFLVEVRAAGQFVDRLHRIRDVAFG